MGQIPITGLRNERAPIVRIEGDMVFKRKIDMETRICMFFGQIQGYVYQQNFR